MSRFQCHGSFGRIYRYTTNPLPPYWHDTSKFATSCQVWCMAWFVGSIPRWLCALRPRQTVCPACSATALPQSCWKLSGSCTRGRTWECPYKNNITSNKKRHSQSWQHVATVTATGWTHCHGDGDGETERVTVPLNVSNVVIFSFSNKNNNTTVYDCCTLQSTSNFDALQCHGSYAALVWPLRLGRRWVHMTWWLSSCWRRHHRVPSWGSLGCPVVGCCWWNWRHTLHTS